jgi:hypothetical protein
MIIKKIAVGNSTEAFVEDGFTDGLNIISSDDNNSYTIHDVCNWQ